ncbi:glycosyltransferase [Anaerotignum faecicola]|nr:glycosyltransferase [Anaerotignum faecicola]
MNKIKVLEVNKMYFPVTGGIERVVQQISEGLKDEVDIDVLVCQKKGRQAKENINGVNVIKSGSMGVLFSMPVSFSFFINFFKLCRKYDVINFHMPFPLGDLACLLSGYNGKVVVWWHSDIVKQKKIMLFYKPIMHRFLKRADVIVAATEGHVEYSEYIKEFKSKCVIIPYGVDKNIAKNAENKITEQNYGPVKFLFVGRLVYYKGLNYLIEAMKNVDNSALTIVGKGPLEQEVTERIEKSGLSGRVEIKNGLNDSELSEEFCKCDVFVLPSVEKSEAFGIVQIEAMIYGKPVINTNLKSGVPYVGINGKTGITVEPRNAAELSNAMNRLALNRDERIRMGNFARKYALEHYSEDKMLKNILKIYKS